MSQQTFNCSKSTIVTLEKLEKYIHWNIWRHWRHSNVFLFNFKHVSHIFLGFLSVILSMCLCPGISLLILLFLITNIVIIFIICSELRAFTNPGNLKLYYKHSESDNRFSTYANFPKKWHFLPPDTHTYVSLGKICVWSKIQTLRYFMIFSDSHHVTETIILSGILIYLT